MAAAAAAAAAARVAVKGPVKDYNRFISARASRRQVSALRALAPLMQLPGMISLGAGFPNASLFPFKQIDFTLQSGEKLTLSGPTLDSALQYGVSYGSAPLVSWIKKRQVTDHSPRLPSDRWEVCVTNGSQDALAKTIDLLVDEGDPILVEDPTYSGALSVFRPYNCKIVGVKTDQDGLVPDSLRHVLQNWQPTLPRPRVLYTIPTGQNPSGTTLPNARRRAVYDIAAEHDLLIIEDDPYWNLRFDGEADLRSLWSLDTEGRVIRLDSFSKIVSSGFRLGWVSGPKPLVERIQLDQQATSIHPSALSQAAVFAVLDQWGEAGWAHQLKQVQELYRERRAHLIKCAEKYLTGRATWYAPSAGMFLWFKLNGVHDTLELIQKKAIEKKVIFVPGRVFSPNDDPSSFVRASFSTATLPDMEEAMRRLAALLDDKDKQ